MSGFAFDADIVVDALSGFAPARAEILRAFSGGTRAWISRIAWLEVMSKGEADVVKGVQSFMSHFGLDEIDEEIAIRAAALRRERPSLKSPDAIILATAQTRGRVLITRNTRDFPAAMPGIRVPYIL